ncbi:MAG: hypothetical protein ABW250_02410 [Pyrinomonadaceae bacterium]
MLILKGIPCSAARQRGILRHSWLKNQILGIDAGFVVQMRGRPSLREARESFERKILPGGEFDLRLGEARQLARDMVDGFSPTQLANSGPLADLPAEVLAAVKSAVHREYLSETGIEQREGPLNAACDLLADALREFSDVWVGRTSGPNMLRKSFEQLQLRARALHEQLEQLPEGIVLP